MSLPPHVQQGRNVVGSCPDMTDCPRTWATCPHLEGLLVGLNGHAGGLVGNSLLEGYLIVLWYVLIPSRHMAARCTCLQEMP